MTGIDVSLYKYIHTYICISPLFWSQRIGKDSMASCSGTGKSQVVSSYSNVAASSDPQRIYKGFPPAQPQQHHCYDMELHKSSHLELVRLITTCSLESRLAPLTPAHLWLQSTVCSSSNPCICKGLDRSCCLPLTRMCTATSIRN